MMKTSLINEYNQALQTMRKGTFSVKQKYKTVMRTIVNDLVTLRCAPKSFSDLREASVMRLIDHWKEKGNTHKTIANKLGILRGFYGLAEKNFPALSNKAMRIKSTCRHERQPVAAESILSRIRHPIVKSIIEFQIEFGLKSSEAIKIDAISTNLFDGLIIPRHIAYNHKDRIIPIVEPSQKNAILYRSSLLNGENCLTDLSAYDFLVMLYRGELGTLGFRKSPDFRGYYAKRRFHSLRQSSDKESAYEMLRQEMGISSVYKIKRLLNE
jgi:site-specific recombinase XerD